MPFYTFYTYHGDSSLSPPSKLHGCTLTFAVSDGLMSKALAVDARIISGTAAVFERREEVIIRRKEGWGKGGRERKEGEGMVMMYD